MFEPYECELSILENRSDKVLFRVQYFLLEAVIYMLSNLAAVVTIYDDFAFLVQKVNCRTTRHQSLNFLKIYN